MGAIFTQKTLPALMTEQALLLPKWRSVTAGVKVGLNNCRVACIGDSITEGTGSITATGAATQAWPIQLAKFLSSTGLNATSNSIFGFAAVARDLRVTVGSSWTIDNAVFSVGGSTIKASTGTNALSYTPTVPVDTFVIWYLAKSPSGTFSADVNGGTATNVNTNVGSQLLSQTVTAPLGLNTLNLKWVSGGTVWIAGIEARNSQLSSVDFINAGWNGSTSVMWNDTTTAYGPGNVNTLAADLYILSLQVNDYCTGVSLSSFNTAMQALITRMKAVGDVLLLTEPPSNPGASGAPALAVQQTYTDAQYALAGANNLPLVDVFSRFVSYAVSNPQGYYYDGLHPRGKGYADMAQALVNQLGNP